MSNPNRSRSRSRIYFLPVCQSVCLVRLPAASESESKIPRPPRLSTGPTGFGASASDATAAATTLSRIFAPRLAAIAVRISWSDGVEQRGAWSVCDVSGRLECRCHRDGAGSGLIACLLSADTFLEAHSRKAKSERQAQHSTMHIFKSLKISGNLSCS